MTSPPAFHRSAVYLRKSKQRTGITLAVVGLISAALLADVATASTFQLEDQVVVDLPKIENLIHEGNASEKVLGDRPNPSATPPGLEGNSYSCQVLRHLRFAVTKMDRAEYGIWFDFLISGEPVSQDSEILGRLKELASIPIREIMNEGARSAMKDSLREILDETCEPCVLGSPPAEFENCISLKVALPSDSQPGEEGDSPSTAPPSEENDSPSTAPPSEENDSAESLFMKKISPQLQYGIDPLFYNCGGLKAVFPTGGRVEIFSYVNSYWDVISRLDFPGKPIAISKTGSTVVPGATQDFLLRFRNSFDDVIEESLLMDSGGCTLTFAQFLVQGISFGIQSLSSLKVDGSTVIGSTGFRSGITFVFDPSRRLFVEQS